MLKIVAERQAIDNAQALGARLSLEYHGPRRIFILCSPDQWLEGRRGNRSVRVWTYTTGFGRSRMRWMAAGVGLTVESPAQFELRPASFTTKMLAWCKKSPTYTGDEAFDRQWYLHTTDARLVLSLTDPVRRMLRNLPTNNSSRVSISNKTLFYAEHGSFLWKHSVRQMERYLPVMLELAAAMETAAQVPD